MSSAKAIRGYLCRAIATFDGDPPDSGFQRGYLAALQDMLMECFDQRAENKKRLKRKVKR